MRPRSVRVFAPASVANLGSGYDVLGIALETPGDVVTARRRKEPGLGFSLKTSHRDVPSDPTNNVASHVARLMLEEFRPPFGVTLTLHKRMPIGSGLGSSAASSVAAAVGVNALLPRLLGKKDLLRFAVEGERMASGSPHADNVAPSLLGGACLIRSYDPLDVISIPVRNSVVWVVVHPHIRIGTAEARDLLPKAVTLQTAVRQWGNISGMTVGLAAGNVALIGKCVEDGIAEPVRGKLIPGFPDVKKAALEAGAFGCSISGSGPSLFAVTSSWRSAAQVGKAMKRAFLREAGLRSDLYVSRINLQGAKMTARA
ncbi:MAG TPA: homoserine kinase [Bacteroidota bacterium]